MQFPIVIGLRRSRFMDGALAVVTIIALGAIASVPWPLQAEWPLASVILFLASLAAYRLAPPIATLRIDADGKISGRPAGQAAFLPLVLLPGATIHPWLTVLRLTTAESRQYRVLITADSAAAEDFRRLRVCLRWRAEFSNGAADS